MHCVWCTGIATGGEVRRLPDAFVQKHMSRTQFERSVTQRLLPREEVAAEFMEAWNTARRDDTEHNNDRATPLSIEDGFPFLLQQWPGLLEVWRAQRQLPGAPPALAVGPVEVNFEQGCAAFAALLTLHDEEEHLGLTD